MPRYFFDIFDGDVLSPDDTGMDCESDLHARDQAIDALPDMAREELPDGAQRTMWVKIRDGTGSPIFEASLELKSRWLREPTPSVHEPIPAGRE